MLVELSLLNKRALLVGQIRALQISVGVGGDGLWVVLMSEFCGISHVTEGVNSLVH